MIVKDTGGGSFEQAPEGTHLARCIKLIDIGTHSSEYQGQINVRRQVIIGWELPDELLTSGEYAGQPFTLSRFYTASLGERANLRKDLMSWRGRDFTPEELAGFELKSILTAPCLLSVAHNEAGRAKVTGVMALPKRTQVAEQVNPTVYFSLDPTEFDQAVFDAFSDKMKALIVDSPEYQLLSEAFTHQTPAANDMDFGGEDGIPF